MPSKLSITKERTAELVAEFGANEHDTGNPDVQVAILSERIRNLTEHLKTHKKDNHTRRGLMMLIGKRRGMLKYIKSATSRSTASSSRSSASATTSSQRKPAQPCAGFCIAVGCARACLLAASGKREYPCPKKLARTTAVKE